MRTERAPVRRDARDPLHNGIPGNMRSGGDDRRVWGVHHHQMPAVKLTCEARENG